MNLEGPVEGSAGSKTLKGQALAPEALKGQQKPALEAGSLDNAVNLEGLLDAGAGPEALKGQAQAPEALKGRHRPQGS